MLLFLTTGRMGLELSEGDRASSGSTSAATLLPMGSSPAISRGGLATSSFSGDGFRGEDLTGEDLGGGTGFRTGEGGRVDGLGTGGDRTLAVMVCSSFAEWKVGSIVG